jgi:outer membrane protein assembly factor BamB
MWHFASSRFSRVFLSMALCCAIRASATAADWPMWRFDAGHTASSPDDLPETLTLKWTREFGRREQVWDDPLNNDLMQYDKIFEPVVMGGRMFVGFNDSDKVVALDVESGQQQWAFHTDGPVRFAPVAWNGNVYFCSDDGHLYCVDATNGTLNWKFRGGPSDQKVIGNQRVISAWPARGGPVIRDGDIYFAASIWPFMGTFIYSLDAETGEVRWANDGTGADYIYQPHGAKSFAGVAPQGTLVATEEVLLVPSGRAVPAAFERKTGKPLYYHHGGKGYGGSFVIAGENEFYMHTRRRGVVACDLKKGSMSKFTCNEPVLADGFVYTSAVDEDDESIRGILVFDPEKNLVGQIEVDATGDLIKVGSRLYAAGEDRIVAIGPSKEDQQPTLLWSHPVEGKVLRLLAAAETLFAVTLDGRIMAFGSGSVAKVAKSDDAPPAKPARETTHQVDTILEQIDAAQGYAFVFGIDDGRTIEGLANRTQLHIVGVDPDKAKIERLRRQFDAENLYGKRIVLIPGDPQSFKAPPYVANLIVVGRGFASESPKPDQLKAIYNSVRPYGGALWLSAEAGRGPQLARDVENLELARAEVTHTAGGVVVRRVGALPGSADWTHQYGNIANTVKSDDTCVKFPLGLLWFGGNSNLDVLPRHGHGPTEQVVGGRLFIEGLNCLSARDAYTGRVMWKYTSDKLGTFGMYYDESHKDTPLSTERNQHHLPGANARGTNFVATKDVVYLVEGSECHLLNAATGETENVFEMPTFDSQGDDPPLWGFIGLYDDILLGGWGFARLDQKTRGKSHDEPLSEVDVSSSNGLVAFDRITGKVLWKTRATHSFLHNGIVAGNGRVYCLDRLPTNVEAKRTRRGKADPSSYRVVAFDAGTGKPLWQRQENIFGTWLGYSKEHDILLQAGAKGVDRQEDDEVGQGMTTYRGRSGDVIWHHDLKYAGPCILHNETIFTNVIRYSLSSGAFSLLDGSPQFVTNPLTGKEEPWRMTRTYGCDAMTACENFLTFRSGAAGFYDLLSKSGTGNLGGFKSSCSGNLIVANGVLNAPDYTRTCSCSYQNQTSLALIHMPEMEMWANSEYGAGQQAGTKIERVGINFGAPGDRMSDEGTLWLDYPSVGGSSPDIEVAVVGEKAEYYRRHATSVSGSDLAWVGASGIRDAESISIRLETTEQQSPDGGVRIVTGDDDVEETKDGSMILDSTELELGRDRTPQIVGLRFRNINLERGQKIEEAAIQFKVDERSMEETELMIHAEASDNAQRFREDRNNISRRKSTSAAVKWTAPKWTKAGRSRPAQQTPNLKDLLQEVIDREGWQQNNSLVFMIRPIQKRKVQSFAFALKGNRVVESFEGNPLGSARLIFKIEEPPDAETDKQEKSVQNQPQTVSEKPPAASQRSNKPQRPYTVRLHFAELELRSAGERVFNVSLQGQEVLRNFDIVEQGGGPKRSVVKEFNGVWVRDTLNIGLSPANGQSAPVVLSGVEIIAEEA